MRLVAFAPDDGEDRRRASAHGAGRGLSQQQNESFRKAGLIVLPVVVVLLIAVFACLRS
ncbi:hypothetical protein [Streptomyces sp. NPDC048496]|uniref:hypothetical protein n=1 Tax=Streptomyces sp. NPDC048496 TaxID=3365558 RepID=UPI0037237777